MAARFVAARFGSLRSLLLICAWQPFEKSQESWTEAPFSPSTDLDPARFDVAEPGLLGVEIFIGRKAGAERGSLMRPPGDDFGRRFLVRDGGWC